MRRPVALGLVVLIGCLDPFPPSMHGMVTFVIDDGNVTDYAVKKPIFDAAGVVAVSAVISSRLVLSNAQLLAMQADGWEIASHSRRHMDETVLTEAQLEDEVGGAKAELERMGLTVTTHVYPYGRFNELVERVVRRHYQAGVKASGGLNVIPLFNRFEISRRMFGYQYTRADRNTLPFYQTLVDSAKHRGLWLVFELHEVDSSDAVMLSQLLEYIRKQSLPVVTIRQGLGMTR